MNVEEYIKKYDRLFDVSPSFKAKQFAEKYNFLDYMIERYIHMFQGELEDFLYHCSIPLVKSIRCNDLLINCEKLTERMRNKGFELQKVDWLLHGYRVVTVPKSPSLGATLEYLSGFYYIQGLASMVPPYVLSPNENDVVLDMAASPGSKTTQISQLMGNKGLILAVEKSRERIKTLLSNINRMKAKNVILLRTDSKNLVNSSLKFSKILLDAPCSGEGLIPEDPSRKTKTTISDLRRFFVEQLLMVNSAYQLLDDGGTLVYSTCSIAPEEDEAVVNFAIEELGMEVEKIEGYPADDGIEEFMQVKFNPEVKKCIRFYPHKSYTEGFFVCKLRKK
ncbi:NOL1/NOP2/sun family putative RNA methylase [Stygiolobus caldivivus]|uniref:RNA methyltransferase n=1 Tax=Stygiolobus caldivivus TaxID=2824673 RepID=A0A8D5U760_9CREN|nr:RsmB/NOP family class I SAM-dependent RNA methyltransferase [Stygiolobus caldivivus]BCU70564.1 RNA methyltransferase [Stygiolobus caldivivus]